jgi:hypothetical protein
MFRVEITEGHPDRAQFTMTEPAVRTNLDYALPFPVPKINPFAWLTDEKVDQMTLKVDGLRKPYKEGNEIEHPAHYNMFPVEAIDVCEHLGFNLGNVVKYTMRADFKGDRIKDLKKALFYLQREIDRDQPVPDTLDDWWPMADQPALLNAVYARLEAKGHLTDKTSSVGINANVPWEAVVRDRGQQKRTFTLDSGDKAAIIAAVDAKPKN